MTRLATLFAATSAALSFATAASANPVPDAGDKLVQYGEVGGWTIYENQTKGDCLIVRSFGPSSVQMGVTADKSVGYIGVFTKEDIGLQNGKVSKVFISIDGRHYSGEATSSSGELSRGYSGGYILSDNPNLKRDLAKRYKMTVFPETKAAFVVDLKGTYKSMAAGRKCLNHSPQ